MVVLAIALNQYRLKTMFVKYIRFVLTLGLLSFFCFSTTRIGIEPHSSLHIFSSNITLQRSRQCWRTLSLPNLSLFILYLLTYKILQLILSLYIQRLVLITTRHEIYHIDCVSYLYVYICIGLFSLLPLLYFHNFELMLGQDSCLEGLTSAITCQFQIMIIWYQSPGSLLLLVQLESSKVL